MFSHGSFSDSKSPQVTRTLLNILAHLKNAIVSMVSTRPLIFKSSSLFNKSSVAMTAVNSFTRVLNTRDESEYIYIYIYICVCVCVCVLGM